MYCRQLQVAAGLEGDGVERSQSGFAVDCHFAAESETMVGVGVVQACVAECLASRRISLVHLLFVRLQLAVECGVEGSCSDAYAVCLPVDVAACGEL